MSCAIEAARMSRIAEALYRYKQTGDIKEFNGVSCQYMGCWECPVGKEPNICTFDNPICNVLVGNIRRDKRELH